MLSFGSVWWTDSWWIVAHSVWGKPSRFAEAWCAVYTSTQRQIRRAWRAIYLSVFPTLISMLSEQNRFSCIGVQCCQSKTAKFLAPVDYCDWFIKFLGDQSVRTSFLCGTNHFLRKMREIPAKFFQFFSKVDTTLFQNLIFPPWKVKRTNISLKLLKSGWLTKLKERKTFEGFE